MSGWTDARRRPYVSSTFVPKRVSNEYVPMETHDYVTLPPLEMLCSAQTSVVSSSSSSSSCEIATPKSLKFEPKTPRASACVGCAGRAARRMYAAFATLCSAALGRLERKKAIFEVKPATADGKNAAAAVSAAAAAATTVPIQRESGEVSADTARRLEDPLLGLGLSAETYNFLRTRLGPYKPSSFVYVHGKDGVESGEFHVFDCYTVATFVTWFCEGPGPGDMEMTDLELCDRGRPMDPALNMQAYLDMHPNPHLVLRRRNLEQKLYPSYPFPAHVDVWGNLGV